MSQCRVARRIALTASAENPGLRAERAPTLVTKDLHLPCRPFPRGGGRTAAEHPATTSQTLGCTRLAGVRLCLGGGGARRLAWRRTSSVTPFIASPLVTNEETSEAAR